jgi:hypothetical protein
MGLNQLLKLLKVLNIRDNLSETLCSPTPTYFSVAIPKTAKSCSLESYSFLNMAFHVFVLVLPLNSMYFANIYLQT